MRRSRRRGSQTAVDDARRGIPGIRGHEREQPPLFHRDHAGKRRDAIRDALRCVAAAPDAIRDPVEVCAVRRTTLHLPSADRSLVAARCDPPTHSQKPGDRRARWLSRRDGRRSAMGDTGISVIVVNWNGRDDVVACLASLRRQTDRNFEVILVDNGSSDDSVACARREFPDLRVLETGANLGFAEACNRGIELSDRAWIAVLNNDTVADPHWIEELRAAAGACSDDVGMIQARIMDRAVPDEVSSTGVVISSGGEFNDRGCGSKWDGRDRVEEIFCASAGAALYRRAMIDCGSAADRRLRSRLRSVFRGCGSRLALPAGRVVRVAGAAGRRTAHPSWIFEAARRTLRRAAVPVQPHRNAAEERLAGAAVSNAARHASRRARAARTARTRRRARLPAQHPTRPRAAAGRRGAAQREPARSRAPLVRGPQLSPSGIAASDTLSELLFPR